MSKEILEQIEFKIGCDPEAFVIDRNTGEIVSAVNLIPGSKDEPYNISDNGHAIQTDNVMVEFCVPPATTSEQLNSDIRFCLLTLDEMLPTGLQTIIQASAFLDKKHLRTKQAKLFGCDPDFSAYTLDQNVAPDSKSNLRTAGGHIHVGYSNPKYDINMKIIIAMDLFLGLPSLVLDKDTERRKAYGKAGAFREKSYGVEYRVLSNFWIQTEETVNWAVEQTKKAVEYAITHDHLDDVTQANLQLAINNQDIDLAKQIATQYGISMSLKEEVLI